MIDFNDYQRLVEAIEDKGLISAMQEVQAEKPLSLNEVLTELQKE